MMLTELANVCRRTGYPVIEVQGWQHRVRGGGPYILPAPTHVMMHHTASPPSWDGDKDASYLAVGGQYAPISNLLISRRAWIYVIAAGPTNTNGSGHDSWGGGVPVNGMNARAIGIEMGNNGIGEIWPDEQQDCALKLSAELCRAYNIPSAHVRAHFEWSPGRKIDPYGPCRWNKNQNTYWDMRLFREDVLNEILKGDDVAAINPFRWFDTRQPPLGNPMKAGQTLTVPVPAQLQGSGQVYLNLTVVPTTKETGYVSVWGNGPRPTVSNVNFWTDRAIANTALVKIGDDRKVRFYAHKSCHLIVDVQGK